MIGTYKAFGDAIEAIKNGKKAKRANWNGKEQYISIATVVEIFEHGEYINPYNDDIEDKAIVFHGTRGIQVGWLASQADMLAEDWIIMED